MTAAAWISRYSSQLRRFGLRGVSGGDGGDGGSGCGLDSRFAPGLLMEVVGSARGRRCRAVGAVVASQAEARQALQARPARSRPSVSQARPPARQQLARARQVREAQELLVFR